MGEKLIFVELVGPNTIAVKFENFFDEEIKNKIKAMPDAKYDYPCKEWLVRKDLKEEMIELIGELCISKGIKISDIPQFAFELVANSIPFSKGKMKEFGRDFNYGNEAKTAKYSLDCLPDKMKENLYEF